MDKAVFSPETCRERDELHALLAKIGMDEIKRWPDADITAEHDYLLREQAELLASGSENTRYGCFFKYRAEILSGEIRRRRYLQGFGGPQLGKPAVSPELVASVKSGISLVDLIGRDIEVRHRGKNWLAKCPYHSSGNETQPSLTIFPDNHWWCFACNTGGDHFDWLRAYHQMEFIQAVEYLAGFAGISFEIGKQAIRSVKVG